MERDTDKIYIVLIEVSNLNIIKYLIIFHH